MQLDKVSLVVKDNRKATPTAIPALVWRCRKAPWNRSCPSLAAPPAASTAIAKSSSTLLCCWASATNTNVATATATSQSLPVCQSRYVFCICFRLWLADQGECSGLESVYRSFGRLFYSRRTRNPARPTLTDASSLTITAQSSATSRTILSLLGHWLSSCPPAYPSNSFPSCASSARPTANSSACFIVATARSSPNLRLLNIIP